MNDDVIRECRRLLRERGIELPYTTDEQLGDLLTALGQVMAEKETMEKDFDAIAKRVARVLRPGISQLVNDVFEAEIEARVELAKLRIDQIVQTIPSVKK